MVPPEQARAVIFDDDRVLRVTPLETAPLLVDEVRYRVEAFALNRADMLYLDDAHYSVARLPSRICSEACGIVEEVGSAVTRFQPGDRVTSIPFHNTRETDHGVAGEMATTPEAYLMPWPEGLSAPEACSVTMQYLTAYYPLVEIAEVGPGDWVLVTAASSSAGLAAIQLARLRGARVIAQTRSGSKSPALLAAGADRAVASDSEDLAAAILDATEGAGVRVAYDPIAGRFIDRYVEALAYGSIVFQYGVLESPRIEADLVSLVRRNAIIHPHSLFNHVNDEAALLRGTTFLGAALARGDLRPVIDTVFPWDRALEAFEYLQGTAHTGKVVVSLA